jgi:hypothetical protein
MSQSERREDVRRDRHVRDEHDIELALIVSRKFSHLISRKNNRS